MLTVAEREPEGERSEQVVLGLTDRALAALVHTSLNQGVELNEAAYRLLSIDCQAENYKATGFKPEYVPTAEYYTKDPLEECDDSGVNDLKLGLNYTMQAHLGAAAHGSALEDYHAAASCRIVEGFEVMRLLALGGEVYFHKKGETALKLDAPWLQAKETRDARSLIEVITKEDEVEPIIELPLECDGVLVVQAFAYRHNISMQQSAHHLLRSALIVERHRDKGYHVSAEVDDKIRERFRRTIRNYRSDHLRENISISLSCELQSELASRATLHDVFRNRSQYSTYVSHIMEMGYTWVSLVEFGGKINLEPKDDRLKRGVLRLPEIN